MHLHTKGGTKPNHLSSLLNVPPPPILTMLINPTSSRSGHTLTESDFDFASQEGGWIAVRIIIRGRGVDLGKARRESQMKEGVTSPREMCAINLVIVRRRQGTDSSVLV